MKLSKKEEGTTRDKIAVWSRHQELDKFNYNDAATKLIGIIAGLLAVLAITLGSPTDLLDNKEKIRLSTWILIATIFVFLYQGFKMHSARYHFKFREDMIDSWYEKLGIKKSDLNDEFLILKAKSQSWIMKVSTKKNVVKGIIVVACLVLIYLVIIGAGNNILTPALAQGLFIALSIVALERLFDLVENLFLS